MSDHLFLTFFLPSTKADVGKEQKTRKCLTPQGNGCGNGFRIRKYRKKSATCWHSWTFLEFLHLFCCFVHWRVSILGIIWDGMRLRWTCHKLKRNCRWENWRALIGFQGSRCEALPLNQGNWIGREAAKQVTTPHRWRREEGKASSSPYNSTQQRAIPACAGRAFWVMEYYKTIGRLDVQVIIYAIASEYYRYLNWYFEPTEMLSQASIVGTWTDILSQLNSEITVLIQSISHTRFLAN